jgi:segregation and condensation protein B
MNRDYLTNLVQCILFLSPAPVKREDIQLHFHVDKDILDQCVGRLKEQCNGTGLELLETAAGMELATRREFIEDLKFFFANIEKMRISRAALETMAIIAYRQPITRAEIEAIRGVNSQGVVNSLMDKGLIRISGKSDAAGRPFIFSTTDEFLRFIGASSLNDIPPLESLQKDG